MIHALTFRMTGSLADAEDLAQESFLRAWEQLGTFRRSAKFSTWLYRIAVNACVDYTRRRGRCGAVPLDDGLLAVSAGAGHRSGSPSSNSATPAAAVTTTVFDGAL